MTDRKEKQFQVGHRAAKAAIKKGASPREASVKGLAAEFLFLTGVR